LDDLNGMKEVGSYIMLEINKDSVYTGFVA
jgi:hypothetical protein